MYSIANSGATTKKDAIYNGTQSMKHPGENVTKDVKKTSKTTTKNTSLVVSQKVKHMPTVRSTHSTPRYLLKRQHYSHFGGGGVCV